MGAQLVLMYHTAWHVSQGAFLKNKRLASRSCGRKKSARGRRSLLTPEKILWQKRP